MNRDAFSVCVYCGSRSGSDPAYAQTAREVGAEIGRRGWELVYGGGNVGNLGGVPSEPVPWQGREHSIQIELPPLAVVGFLAE